MGFVQGLIDSNNTTNQHNNAFPSDNVAGNLLIVVVSCYNSGMSPTCSDSQGNTYTPGTKVTSSGGGLQVFFAPNCKGGPNTVTTTVGGGFNNQIIIAEYTPITASPADGANQAGQNAGPSSVSSGNINTTQAKDWLIGVAFQRSIPAAVTFTSGFNQRLGVPAGNSTCNIVLMEQEVSATGTYSFGVTANLSAIQSSAAGIYAFKEAGDTVSISGDYQGVVQ